MMSVLENFSDAIAGVVERAGGSVVRVEGRRGAPASGIAWTADGVVLTADHALERDDDIQVGLPGGGTATGRVIGRDPTTDVALVRTDASGLALPSWRGVDGLRPGQVILVLSRPGAALRSQLGILSAVAPAWRTPGGAQVEAYLQPDVTPSWGFSGGLMVDVSGQALGMTTRGLMPRTPLAVPAPTLRRVGETLLARGRIGRGYLGIAAFPIRIPEQLGQAAGQGRGLIVVGIEPGSPADRAGLVLGDVIVAVDGEPVRHHGDVAARLGPETVGRSVPVRLLRAGAVQEVAVTVGER